MSENLNCVSIGSGTPLLFQHGLGANSTQIKKLLEPLENTQLLSFDCPGHGKSILHDSYSPSFSSYSNSIIQELNKRNLKNLFVGGLSMGAGIALNITLQQPKLIRGIILLRPAWIDKPAPENLKILMKAANYIDLPNGLKHFSSQEDLRKVRSNLPLAAESILGVFSSSQQSNITNVLRQLIQDRPLNDLKQLSGLNVPCLILANDDDPLHPFHIAEKFANSIRNSSLIKVTSRYISADRHKKQVIEHIQEFMESNI